MLGQLRALGDGCTLRWRPISRECTEHSEGDSTHRGTRAPLAIPGRVLPAPVVVPREGVVVDPQVLVDPREYQEEGPVEEEGDRAVDPPLWDPRVVAGSAEAARPQAHSRVAAEEGLPVGVAVVVLGHQEGGLVRISEAGLKWWRTSSFRSSGRRTGKICSSSLRSLTVWRVKPPPVER